MQCLESYSKLLLKVPCCKIIIDWKWYSWKLVPNVILPKGFLINLCIYEPYFPGSVPTTVYLQYLCPNRLFLIKAMKDFESDR